MSLQYRVPQNIEIEDTVIGPLTIKQFMYLFVAFIISALIYVTIRVDNFFMLFLILMPFWSIFLALAFLKPNDRPADIFLMAAINFYIKPRQRVWKRVAELNDAPTEEIKQEIHLEKSLPEKKQLSSLAGLLDIGTNNTTVQAEDYQQISPQRNASIDNYLSEKKESLKDQNIEPTISQLASISPEKSLNYLPQEDLSDDYIIKMAYQNQRNRVS